MSGRAFVITPEYRAASDTFRDALRDELAVAQAFSADRTDANWAKCVEAHEASRRAKVQMDALEPGILS
jgi:hypothetical protein